MRLSGQSSAASSGQRERAVGWKPVCRPPREVRPDSTLREAEYRLSLIHISLPQPDRGRNPRGGRRGRLCLQQGHRLHRGCLLYTSMAACCLVPYAAEDVAAMRLVTSLTLVEEQLKRTVVRCV